MKQDHEDPNNHVPDVSPDDDWADLDEGLSSSTASGLPPKRTDRGIPAKKKTRTSHENLHPPQLKLYEDSSDSPFEPRDGKVMKETEPPQDAAHPPEEPTAIAGGKTSGKTSGKGKGKANTGVKKSAKNASIAGKKPVKKTSKKVAGKKVSKAAEKTSAPQPKAPEGSESVAADLGEQRIVLPAAHGHRRGRVNEIDPSREVSLRSVPKMDPMPKPRAEQGGLKNVPRLHRRHNQRGEHGDWGAKTAQGSLRWTLYTGVGVIALVISAVVLSQRGGKKPDGREQSFFSMVAPDATDEGGEEEALEALRKLNVAQDEARRIYAIYATAKTADDFMGVVYRAEENAGVIAESWKPMGMAADWKTDDNTTWSALEQQEYRYGVLEGALPNFTTFNAYFRHEAQGLKLDWKATSGYCSADFTEMKAGRGDGSEIRALLSPADFHTFVLPEGDYRSYRLVSPDGQTNLWGYTEVGGEVDGKLLEQFVPSQITGEAQSEISVVLGLEPGPEDALPSQWMIRKLVRLNWLDE